MKTSRARCIDLTVEECPIYLWFYVAKNIVFIKKYEKLLGKATKRPVGSTPFRIYSWSLRRTVPGRARGRGQNPPRSQGRRRGGHKCRAMAKRTYEICERILNIPYENVTDISTCRSANALAHGKQHETNEGLFGEKERLWETSYIRLKQQ